MRVLTKIGIGIAQEMSEESYYVWINNSEKGKELPKSEVFPVSQWGILKIIEIKGKLISNFHFYKTKLDADRYFFQQKIPGEVVVYLDFERGIFYSKDDDFKIFARAYWTVPRIDGWDDYTGICFEQIYQARKKVKNEKWNEVNDLRVSLMLTPVEEGRILNSIIVAPSPMGVVMEKNFAFQYV